jgi:hypothetical protein
LVHQLPVPSTDYLLTNPKFDLMYYEPQLGGHESLGALNSPDLYDWMFSHTLAVPEPSSISVLLIGLLAAAVHRSRR